MKKMYLEHRKFYADLLAAAEAHLAEASNPEDGWETLYCEEERWCVNQEIKEAKRLLAIAVEEFEENEESIVWELEQKADQCCEYDYCDCGEEDYYDEEDDS
jgi:hypothetical protein